MAAPEEPRRNQYFLPGEGIEREVIQSDLCKYLDNDAICRPGAHNGIQGFFIYAYRNLTNEMLKDLRADSEKFRREKEKNRERQRRNARSNRSAPHDLRYTESDTYEHNRARLEERNSDTPVQHRGMQGPPPGNYTHQGGPQYSPQHPQSGLYHDQQGYTQPQQGPGYPSHQPLSQGYSPHNQQQQHGFPPQQQQQHQHGYPQRQGNFPTYMPSQQQQQQQPPPYPQQQGGYAPPQPNYVQNSQVYSPPPGYGGHQNQGMESVYGSNAPQQSHGYPTGQQETYVNYSGNQQHLTQQQQQQLPQQQPQLQQQQQPQPQQQQTQGRYDYDYGSRPEMRPEEQVQSRSTNIKSEEETSNYSDQKRRTKDSKQDRAGSSKEARRRNG